MSMTSCKDSITLNSSKVVNKREKGICVVVPAYNEYSRISAFMLEAGEFLRRNKDSVILIADDGSTDGTVNRIKAINCCKRLKILEFPHQGKWGAIRSAFFRAEHKIVAILDCDLSVDFDFVEKNYKFFGNVLFGNRYASIETEVPFNRWILSRGFSALVRFLTGVYVKDSQSPAKILKRDKVVSKAMFEMEERGFIGDVELCILLERNEALIEEIPVKYIYKRGGFKVIKNTKRMFSDLIRLHFKYFWGDRVARRSS